MGIRRAIALVVASSAALLTSAADAVAVQVQLYGLVTKSNTALVSLGNIFDFSFTYETSAAGECEGAFSAIHLYRCLDVVSEAQASLGRIALSTLATQPFPSPIGHRQSFLQAENTDNLFPTPLDEFQGSVNFDPIPGISFPIVAFYLVDLTGTAMSSPPRLPTAWDAASVAGYQQRQFVVYDYANGADVVASGVITLSRPVPENSTYAMMVLGLGLVLWAAGKQRAPRNVDSKLG